MPNKPGKFCIKLLILTDASSPYGLNIQPYLGKHFDEDQKGLQLREYAVLKLSEPSLN